MYDLIIIGSGPCGLTASIYACCFNLKNVVIGKVLGGQLTIAPDIINYPGFEHISGTELTEKMAKQAKNIGAEIIEDSVVAVKKIAGEQSEQHPPAGGFEISSEQGNTFQAKTIILATGTERRKLNVKGEVEYTGKGVDYCATCHDLEIENKTISIIGGANSAITAAIRFAEKAQKVFIIYRGSELRGDPIKLEQIKNNPKIEIIYNATVTEIVGDGQRATSLSTISTSSTSPISLPVDKVVIEIGGVPGTALVIPLGIELDEQGFIKVEQDLSTNIPGIFAAGDVISSKLSIEQITSAVGLGSRAATSAFSYLNKEKAPILWGKSQIKR